MDEPDEVSSLTNAQLYAGLCAFGHPVAPITDTTRVLFEKKLRQYLGTDHSGSSGDKPGTETDVFVDSSAKQQPVVDDKENNNGTKSAAQYFGVQLPQGSDKSPASLVFNEWKDALKLVKEHPGSRFKVFTEQAEALEFVQLALPVPEVSLKADDTPKEPSAPCDLKRAIEKGDIDAVRSLIWLKVSHLVNSGDVPTIHQIGCRYNALHVAALKNQPAICSLILETLVEPNYLSLFYPEDSAECNAQRASRLVDLYLNMPDKGNNETPLHFACKFGFDDVVAILVSYTATNKMARNKYGETAHDLVCSRVKKSSPGRKDKILRLLEDSYIVPLLRTDDNTEMPQVAEPLPLAASGSPQANDPVQMTSDIDLLSSPQLVAYAGPMCSKEAEKFGRTWRSKHRFHSREEARRLAEILRSDSEKGLERVGRLLAKQMGVEWREYWQFLDQFTDLTTEDGLTTLEEYLRKRAEASDDEDADQDGVKSLERRLSRLSLDDADDSPTDDSQSAPAYTNDLIGRVSNLCNENTSSLADNVLQLKTLSDSSGSISKVSSVNGDSKMAPRDSAEDDRDSVSSSLLSYYTARDDDVEVFDDCRSTPCTPRTVFIHGCTPTRTDRDVLRALHDATVSPIDHPRVTQWRHMVLSYSEEARSSWSSPKRTAATASAVSRPSTCLSCPRPSWGRGESPLLTIPGTPPSSRSKQNMEGVRLNLASQFSSCAT